MKPLILQNYWDMEQNKNIIITNVGRRGYLVDYLKEIPSFTGNVYVSDCDDTASGLYGNNDGRFILPRPVDNEELYVQELTKLCKKQQIGIVIPVIDPEIFILSKYREKMLADGINVIVSDKRVLDICYDKIQMNAFLAANGFLVAKTYTDLDSFTKNYDLGEIHFPVIVKPIYGSGSVETSIVNSLEKVNTIFHEGLMIQEVLKGIEYGCDVFNTFEKKPVRCVIKKKISMRSGETDKSITVDNKNLQQLGIDLGNKLGHIGNLDFDVFETDKGPYVIDINPRFGGGYPATHAAGSNHLELLIRMCSGEHIESDFDSYKKNLLVMKEIKVATHLITE